MQLDLRTSYEWKEDKPSGVVQDATIWKSRRDSRGCVQVTSVRYPAAPLSCISIERMLNSCLMQIIGHECC